MTITITPERDGRTSREGLRYRAKVHAQPGGPSLFMTSRALGSIAAAKRQAELAFGRELEWKEPGPTFDPDVRAVAYLDLERQ